MNSKTNTGVSALAAFISAMLFWVLGFFYPEFMEGAPTGIESMATGALITIIGFLAKPDAIIKPKQ